MTATFKVDGTDTTVEFSYTALTVKVQEVIYAVAENLWQEETDEEGVVTNPFSEATNSEKLAVADKHVKNVLVDMANSFLSNKAQKEAREAEEASKLEL